MANTPPPVALTTKETETPKKENKNVSSSNRQHRSGNRKKDANAYLLAGFQAILTLIVAIVGPLILLSLGEKKGAEGKKPGFDQIQTDVRLDGTRWKVAYDDVDVQGGAVKREAVLLFNQFGSRIVGEGTDNEGTRWILEGAAAQRRVCYIYYDSSGNRLSFGTVMLEVKPSGVQMVGQWAGWSPELDLPRLQNVTLTKLPN